MCIKQHFAIGIPFDDDLQKAELLDIVIVTGPQRSMNLM